jgi:membrane protein
MQRLTLAEKNGFPSQRKTERDESPAHLASEGEDRGPLATSPSEIPAKGRKDILPGVYDDISEHRILALAAGMTYYTILAIFPALAALVAIYGLFSNPEIDAEMEHQTAHDTTEGAPKPMGVRGARMADTIGAARGN